MIPGHNRWFRIFMNKRIFFYQETFRPKYYIVFPFFHPSGGCNFVHGENSFCYFLVKSFIFPTKWYTTFCHLVDQQRKTTPVNLPRSCQSILWTFYQKYFFNVSLKILPQVILKCLWFHLVKIFIISRL